MKKSLTLIVSILMLVGLSLSGCTTAAPTAAPTIAATAAPTVAPTPTPEPAPTAVLRFGTASLDGKFNPIICDGVYDQYVCSMLFDSLVTNEPDGSVSYRGLAKDCIVSDDHLTYTLHLKDATFSNGDPVTAGDVKFTYETIANPKYDGPLGYVCNNIVGYDEFNKGTAKEITGIKAIDDKTVSITIKEPYVAELISNIGGVGILDQKYYAFKTWDEFKALDAKPMGCGAFTFKDYVSGQACNLVLNPTYYGQKPALAGVSILIIPDETQIQALMTGQVDVVNPAANKDNWDAMNADPNSATAIKFVGNGYNVVGYDLKNPLFSDKKVRQALYYGLDFDSFIQTQWQGLATRCLTPISPVSWAYPDVSKLNPYHYDPAKANQLLDEAGWTQKDKDGIRMKDGKRFSFTWIAYTDSAWPKNLQALAVDQWKKIGVEMKSELMDFNTMSDKVFTQGKFEMFNIGWSLSIDPDPVGMYDAASDIKGGYNAMHYNSPDAEAIFKAERTEFDQAKRTQELQQWAQIANDELPYMFCAVRDEIWGVSSKFTGFDKMGPYYNWVSCLNDVKAK